MTSDWKAKERLVRNAIEKQGFVVHDANIVLDANCRNIDLIVFGKDGALYLQVKSSNRPAGRNSVVVGAKWTRDELFEGAPIFNKHDHYRAKFIVIVDALGTGEIDFYVVPPETLTKLLVKRGREFAAIPKRDGSAKAVGFWKELPRSSLRKWRNAWEQLGLAPMPPQST